MVVKKNRVAVGGIIGAMSTHPKEYKFSISNQDIDETQNIKRVVIKFLREQGYTVIPNPKGYYDKNTRGES